MNSRSIALGCIGLVTLGTTACNKGNPEADEPVERDLEIEPTQ